MTDDKQILEHIPRFTSREVAGHWVETFGGASDIYFLNGFYYTASEGSLAQAVLVRNGATFVRDEPIL